MIFYVGLNTAGHAWHFEHCMISISRIRYHTRCFRPKNWILDSGAFSEISRFGRFRDDFATHAKRVRRWLKCGNLQAVIPQDWMCEPFILKITKLSVFEHQMRTIDSYDYLVNEFKDEAFIMPVLQGYEPEDYVIHLEEYGERVAKNMWVGVGSVCKRNSDPLQVLYVLRAIKRKRPDIRIHAFGLKLTALEHPDIRALLHSTDSMAWAMNAFYSGRDQSDWREAAKYVERINSIINSA